MRLRCLTALFLRSLRVRLLSFAESPPLTRRSFDSDPDEDREAEPPPDVEEDPSPSLSPRRCSPPRKMRPLPGQSSL